MLAAVNSAAVLGIDAVDVIVEVDVSAGLPRWTVVGLASSAVKESCERVNAALGNSGLKCPPRRITINLSPANLKKDGTAFDLPIAIGVLAALGIVPIAHLEHVLLLGELGLDGTLRPIRGVLPVARRAARRESVPTLVIPPANVAEASLVARVPLSAPATLLELVSWLVDGHLPTARCDSNVRAEPVEHPDLSDVIGQETARRAMEIAAAGGHNALLIGPPGAGKTMLARRLPSILPSPSEEEILEATAIHSVAGVLPHGRALAERPFRAPHHSISTAGLVGGGSTPRPGEVSLAHHGVLFLDELLEFPRHALEAMRQPLEDGRVVVARAGATVGFPARFTLVGATNPCPCGHAGDASHPCTCSAVDVQRYRSRLSGPLIDRIDVHVTLQGVALAKLGSREPGESSASVRVRVERARDRQRARFRRLGIRSNAEAGGRWLDLNGGIQPEARGLLATAAERLGLSARAYHRVMRVSRTIADLDDSKVVGAAHVGEALRYRPAMLEGEGRSA